MGSFSPISYLVCTFEQKATHQIVVCGNICPFARGFLLIGYCMLAVIACLKEEKKTQMHVFV